MNGSVSNKNSGSSGLVGKHGLSVDIPRHVAIIMDGNGRWAKRHGKPRVYGHEAGIQSVRRVLEESRRLGIEFLTIYAFSSENWYRPKEEVSALMGLFGEYLVKESPNLVKQDIKLRAIGDRSRLAEDVLSKLEEVEGATSGCKALNLILAISYGGRDEIVRAVKRVIRDVSSGKLDASGINSEVFSRYLDTAGVPDPDLLIRTSGESRISNFLLWQLAYTEIVVTDTLWPDFSKDDFNRCIVEYSKRERRFGRSQPEGVNEEVISVGANGLRG